jgi:hypothetical protein
MHCETSPIKLARYEVVPMTFEYGLPRLVLGYEPPERRKIDDDTVVEIDRLQRCDTL